MGKLAGSVCLDLSDLKPPPWHPMSLCCYQIPWPSHRAALARPPFPALGLSHLPSPLLKVPIESHHLSRCVIGKWLISVTLSNVNVLKRGQLCRKLTAWPSANPFIILTHKLLSGAAPEDTLLPRPGRYLPLPGPLCCLSPAPSSKHVYPVCAFVHSLPCLKPFIHGDFWLLITACDSLFFMALCVCVCAFTHTHLHSQLFVSAGSVSVCSTNHGSSTMFTSATAWICRCEIHGYRGLNVLDHFIWDLSIWGFGVHWGPGNCLRQTQRANCVCVCVCACALVNLNLLSSHPVLNTDLVPKHFLLFL